MEGKTKVTKEVLCEESRFILANVLAEARYGRQNRYEDIRRVCEGAVSIPFSEYVVFLESAGYLRHERVSTIGSGGIGTVYRARQMSLNRQVALKEIRDLFGFFPEDQQGEIVRRFTEVVRQGASLAHSNILPIHEANLERDFPYVVSELAPYGSARRLITDAESIPVGLALKYLIQTLHALRAAHREGVAHRGLKPENMLIDAYGN